MKVYIIRMETSLAQLIVVGLVFVREVMSDVTLRNVQPQSVITRTENQDPVVLPARKVRLRLQLVQNIELFVAFLMSRLFSSSGARSCWTVAINKSQTY